MAVDFLGFDCYAGLGFLSFKCGPGGVFPGELGSQAQPWMGWRDTFVPYVYSVPDEAVLRSEPEGVGRPGQP